MSDRIKKWLVALIWLLMIYASIPFVRSACEYFREAKLLNPSIILCAGAIAFYYIRFLIRKGKPDAVGYAVLSVVIFAYIVGLAVITIPEERLHFIQYGVLAYLINEALQQDVRGWRALLIAFVLTSLFGWLDEWIQYITPGRYYDNRDVILNSVSGVLGLMLDYVGRRASI